MTSPRHRAGLLFVLLCSALLGGVVVWWRSSVHPAVYRLLDRSQTPAGRVSIDGVSRRTIEPPSEVFTLPRHGPRPVLSFSIGRARAGNGGRVRFEVHLERAPGAGVDGRTLLFRKDLSEPGWVDERIELPAADLAGARVWFVRELVDGPPALHAESGFANPLLWSESPARRPPSVILISLDTLRADRVGLYGYSAARTPVLDAFGAAGVWYAQAYSPSTWTLPSHASLLHGDWREGVPPPAEQARFPSLAETLADSGYLTAAFTGGGWLSINQGFARGFDTYFAYSKPEQSAACPPDRLDGAEVFARARAWLREHGTAPFFLFVHTYDPHDRCSFLQNVDGRWIVWPRLPADARARLLAYYDDLIAGTDTLVGHLLDEVAALGLAEQTLIVVTSDHGEAFSEHDIRGHGKGMKPYEEVVRVPLLVRYPAALERQGVVNEPVSQVAVAPTILTLLGITPPASMIGGALPGLGLTTSPRPVYVASDDVIAVRDGDLKLIRSTSRRFADELYDLANDPGERTNLAGARPELVAQLGALGDRAVQHGSDPVSEDPETLERLRVLGYAE